VTKFSHIAGFLVGVFAVGLCGCNTSEQQGFAPIQSGSCSGIGCSSSSNGSGSDGGTSDDAGDSGTTSDAETVDAGTATVSGQVILVTDTQFAVGSAYPQDATINAQSNSTVTTSIWTGTSFSVSNANVGLNWFRTTPLATSGVYGSLVLVDVPTAGTDFLKLPVISEDILTSIYNTLPNPSTLQSNAPMLVVNFIDGSGAGVSGIEVLPNFTADIFYDDAATFSQTSTGARGQSIMMNIMSASAPSFKYKNSTATSADISVDLQSRTVTFLTISL
jgi:hypothetical protein